MERKVEDSRILKPYSLTGEGADSQPYHETIRVFTDRALELCRGDLFVATAEFESFIRMRRSEEPRGADEAAFELLLLGTLWNLYAKKTATVPAAVTSLLARLVEARVRHPRRKRAIDAVRGVLGTVFLPPGRGEVSGSVSWSVRGLKKLILWMEATGEYSQEANRLQSWSLFLESLEPARAEEILRAASRTARRFEAEAAGALGFYTRTLGVYQKRREKAHRFRESYFMFAKTQVEYHVSMFGAEVLNRACRREFLQTERRILLLPGCMRGENEKHCRAGRQGLDMKCVGCTQSCHIGRLHRQGRSEGFEVSIILHASNCGKWLAKWRGRRDLGVVGVTCVPNVLRGGYEMKRLGIPFQCVLLDFAGCQKHWLPQGVPTCVDRCEVSRRLGHNEDKKWGRPSCFTVRSGQGAPSSRLQNMEMTNSFAPHRAPPSFR